MDPLGKVQTLHQRAQHRLIRAGAGEHQLRLGQQPECFDCVTLAFARDQRANAGEDRAILRQAQFFAALGAVERLEHRAVEAGAVDGDLAPLCPQRDQFVCQTTRNRQQSVRADRRLAHLCSGAGGLSPKVHIGAAGLDRAGQVERLGDAQSRRAIGVEELRVDQIERRFSVHFMREWEHGTGFGPRAEAAAGARQHGKTWAIDFHSAALFKRVKTTHRPVTRVQREREWGHTLRRNHHQIDVTPRRHRLHLSLDKHPEVGGISVRIKCR